MESFLKNAIENIGQSEAPAEKPDAGENPVSQNTIEAKPSVFSPPQDAPYAPSGNTEGGGIDGSAADPTTSPVMDSGFSQPASQPISQPVSQAGDIQQKSLGEDFDDLNDAKIFVVGCGGAGNNGVSRLYKMGIKGAVTIAINTDKKHLEIISADKRLLIGKELTRGLGAGGYPYKGKQAAEESAQEIKRNIDGCDMVFVVAGLGGGTGSGAAPVVAKIAKSLNAIVIGVVTMPFKIEGSRQSKAEEGLANLRQVCDTVIVIENDKLLEIAGEMPLQQAFAVADEIIVTMIKGISETISTPSLVNLDYADVKAVMSDGGVAVVGVGESSTAARAREAVEEAMSNPLLDVDFNGATGALIHVTGGPDLKLNEINEVGEFVSKHLDPDAQTIWGARIDDSLQGRIRVITIITGVHSQYILGPKEQKASDNLGSSLGIRMV